MIELIRPKEIYTTEEKKLILERLNEERLKRSKTEAVDPKEKRGIPEKLERERQEMQERKEFQKSRFGDKKVYILENREFYKILGMGREYYIKVEDCKNISPSSPEILTLFHRGFDGLRKLDMLIQFKDYSEKIFISEDVLRVYFKQAFLEVDNDK